MKKHQIFLCLLVLLSHLLSLPCHAHRDLEAGVFLSRDPAGMVDGPNVYTYVRQNPWTKFDPLGLREDKPSKEEVTQGERIAVASYWNTKGEGDRAKTAAPTPDGPRSVSGSYTHESVDEANSYNFKKLHDLEDERNRWVNSDASGRLAILNDLDNRMDALHGIIAENESLRGTRWLENHGIHDATLDLANLSGALSIGKLVAKGMIVNGVKIAGAGCRLTAKSLTAIEARIAARALAKEASKTLPKGERLALVYDRVRGAPAATTAEEAMGQMHGTLDAVEDAFSGVPKAANPGLKPDGRMYPVQPDRIFTGADGTMTATSRGHVTSYGPNGSITVTDRATGAVVFHKPGGG